MLQGAEKEQKFCSVLVLPQAMLSPSLRRVNKCKCGDDKTNSIERHLAQRQHRTTLEALHSSNTESETEGGLSSDRQTTDTHAHHIDANVIIFSIFIPVNTNHACQPACLRHVAPTQLMQQHHRSTSVSTCTVRQHHLISLLIELILIWLFYIQQAQMRPVSLASVLPPAVAIYRYTTNTYTLHTAVSSSVLLVTMLA